MKTKHTPGPWVTGINLPEYGLRRCGHVHASDGKSVAKATVTGREGNWRDNARLIAAAPEMFDLIVEYRRRLNKGEYLDLQDRIEALIARIEGDNK